MPLKLLKLAIFRDFVDHLERIEAEVMVFQTLPIQHWQPNSRCWRGFFRALRERLGTGTWRYVANQSGGFMGFWWGEQNEGATTVYLQLEHERLVAKVSVEDLDKAARKSRRESWSKAIVDDPNLPRFRRPKRIGAGATSTIAEAIEGYRVEGPGGLLDLEETARGLERARILRNWFPAETRRPNPNRSASKVSSVGHTCDNPGSLTGLKLCQRSNQDCTNGLSQAP